MSFPTQVDLDFFNSKRTPAWADRIRRTGWRGPAESWSDLCVNAHAGIRPTGSELETSNMLVFVRGWMRRGESVLARLRELIDVPAGPYPRKRAALARKWIRRLEERSVPPSCGKHGFCHLPAAHPGKCLDALQVQGAGTP